MEKVPNFVLYMLFGSLGEKLLKETGYDIMATDLNPKVREMDLPAYFMVGNKDKVAGTENVIKLYNQYKGNQF